MAFENADWFTLSDTYSAAFVLASGSYLMVSDQDTVKLELREKERHKSVTVYGLDYIISAEPYGGETHPHKGEAERVCRVVVELLRIIKSPNPGQTPEAYPCGG